MKKFPLVRPALRRDTPAIGRLLHQFNTEFHEATPPAEALATRLDELMASGETVVLLAEEQAGLAVLRFRKAIWTAGLECYLAELYVVPQARGRGLGRALMVEALRVAKARGADWMDLGTEEGDRVARALYESLGFTNRANGQLSYFYEREL